MKDTIKYVIFNLLVAITVYFLLFIVGGRVLIGWVIIIAAFAFAVWFRRSIRSPWWLLWLEMKLFSILPGGSRGGKCQ